MQSSDEKGKGSVVDHAVAARVAHVAEKEHPRRSQRCDNKSKSRDKPGGLDVFYLNLELGRVVKGPFHAWSLGSIELASATDGLRNPILRFATSQKGKIGTKIRSACN